MENKHYPHIARGSKFVVTANATTNPKFPKPAIGTVVEYVRENENKKLDFQPVFKTTGPSINGSDLVSIQWQFLSPVNNSSITNNTVSKVIKHMSNAISNSVIETLDLIEMNEDDRLLQELGLEDDKKQPTVAGIEVMHRLAYAEKRAAVLAQAKRVQAYKDAEKAKACCATRS